MVINASAKKSFWPVFFREISGSAIVYNSFIAGEYFGASIIRNIFKICGSKFGYKSKPGPPPQSGVCAGPGFFAGLL